MTKRFCARGDGGQVTAFVVIFVTAILFVAGLVYDGGNMLAARRDAANIAAQAARAGAQKLSDASVRAGGNDLDAAAARSAVRDFVSNTKARVVGEPVVAGDSITVTVAVDQSIGILKMIGNTKTFEATATARNVRGVVQAET